MEKRYKLKECTKMQTFKVQSNENLLFVIVFSIINFKMLTKYLITLINVILRKFK